ncbi:ArsR family transcriptional regulator [Streptomyces pluripotens]|uniref:ArsR family transcriptional regulator n=1 Tax=Streptomyces pluripotens TaxID=1355015 RepID=A0A221NXN3_9ACTN|nr:MULTISPECIES: helix-turn-helix domain-containing protein [Streptomyces]ARP70454.1 transcriptional regulator [Streptomyces pluripotens]ASN24710.1 ArsR family transcriptional regulator [Streptomyces pluripotens]KIE23133.1 ArsR family transcriptional regulator [Streptomyces sp. MUSC 125]MCH0560782.1 helix-turn-helix transcriptional regulator [Streptomyces sp. MUM 16J]
MTEEHDAPKHRRLDARSLRGLAHPLRMQLLDALRHNGPATASHLAARLGESSGATSYHLRQLAAHGFVEDAPEHGKGRERWWRAVDQGIAFDSDEFEEAGPEVRGLAEVFLQEVASTHARDLAAWLNTRADWPEPWNRSSSDMSDATLRLTPDLAAELIAKMHALIDDYRNRVPDQGAPGAEHVRIHTHLFPIETD